MDVVRPSKAPWAGTMIDACVKGKGDLVINPHPVALVAASPVADRRIRAGCKRLEEEVVV